MTGYTHHWMDLEIKSFPSRRSVLIHDQSGIRRCTIGERDDGKWFVMSRNDLRGHVYPTMREAKLAVQHFMGLDDSEVEDDH